MLHSETIATFANKVKCMDEEKILEVCSFCELYFDLDFPLLSSRSKEGTYIVAKHIVWYFLHYEYNISTSSLAKHFNRSRRNIFLGISKIKNGIDKQRFYKDVYMKFCESYKKKSASLDALFTK